MDDAGLSRFAMGLAPVAAAFLAVTGALLIFFV